eukprot:CAMPEP_0197902980 /NCGR_PEP_ID=MMETSP1439-20131203/54836_1 /TAXON_ID=66791 /ORGANISM="Gonyaulax spinifera, Strain CCMP409" /LENGTH=129 /DNA_ID=CAMNT_0043524061 /DNA_START=93 /DNA_END=478 /DNA_ORIENTATION=+
MKLPPDMTKEEEAMIRYALCEWLHLKRNLSQKYSDCMHMVQGLIRMHAEMKRYRTQQDDLLRQLESLGSTWDGQVAAACSFPGLEAGLEDWNVLASSLAAASRSATSASSSFASAAGLPGWAFPAAASP